MIAGVLEVDDREQHRPDDGLADVRGEHRVADRRVLGDPDRDRRVGPVDDHDRARLVGRAEVDAAVLRHEALLGVRDVDEAVHQILAAEDRDLAGASVIRIRAEQMRGVIGAGDDEAGGERRHDDKRDRRVQILRGGERGGGDDVRAGHGANAVLDRGDHQIFRLVRGLGRSRPERALERDRGG